MTEFSINNSTTAENDRYLIDCFHDAGFINTLIKEKYSIIAGRKGTGKTAIARFLEQKYEAYSLMGSLRIPITSFTSTRLEKGSEQTKEKMILFILLKTVRYFFDNNLLIIDHKKYWETVFEETGFNSVSNFDGFETVTRKSTIGASLAGWIKGKTEETRTKKTLEITSDSVFSALEKSLEWSNQDTQYLIFIDDVSDYLDESKKEHVREDIHIIKDVLFKFDFFNNNLNDLKKGLRFVSCIRDDLFEFMEGSNINKLKTNSLFLVWDEKSFAGLLIRRLPHFKNKNESLDNAIEEIRKLFPDEIFQSRLDLFDTKRYATNFYAYMVAISFNRPRDFLAFCYAMRERLSLKHEVLIENIDASEIEYTDYFMSEIRDELFLASRIFGFQSDSDILSKLVDVLSKKQGFNSSQLRTEISMIINEKTSIGRKKIEQYVYQLWWYGIIGFKETSNSLVNFRYITSTARFVADKANKYVYYLHRGLWWFVQKRKEGVENK